MNELMAQLLEGKRQARSELARLPFSEKVKMLEKLRDRSLLIANSPLGLKARATKSRREFRADFAQSKRS